MLKEILNWLFGSTITCQYCNRQVLEDKFRNHLTTEEHISNVSRANNIARQRAIRDRELEQNRQKKKRHYEAINKARDTVRKAVMQPGSVEATQLQAAIEFLRMYDTAVNKVNTTKITVEQPRSYYGPDWDWPSII